MPTGIYNSSITRVRPFFHKLFAKDWTGESWLPALIGLATENKSFAENLTSNVTPLKKSLFYRRPFKDRILKTYGADSIELEDCFERPLPPSRVFLEWLIRHPGAMTWPENGRRPFGQTTQRLREKLFAGDKWAAEEAISALKAIGPKGSSRKWWAFEGYTEVDCYFETENLVLFIEGKRTEPLSSATDWYPKRNQLVRNLEVAREVAKGKEFAVMILCEEPLPPIADKDFIEGVPHLEEGEALTIKEHFLGCVTWREACQATGINYADLPETTEQALESFRLEDVGKEKVFVPNLPILETWEKKLAEEGRRKEIAENICSPGIARIVREDSTSRLSCRKGEFLLWLSYGGLDGVARGNLKIVDIWEMRDGDFVTITNRMCDLPPWFVLHPTETFDSAAFAMMDRVKKGDYPPEPMDGPNLWRVNTGDRLVWIGTRRRRDVPWPVIAVHEFTENAIAIGESNRAASDFMSFGDVTDESVSTREGDLFSAGIEAARRLGIPRRMSVKWSIGWV